MLVLFDAYLFALKSIYTFLQFSFPKHLCTKMRLFAAKSYLNFQQMIYMKIVANMHSSRVFDKRFRVTLYI